MGKTPPLLMGGGMWFATSEVMHFSLGGLDSPFINGQGRNSLQHLESCTGVWVGKTPTLLMVRSKVVCNIWSHALEFQWLRLPPC